MGYYEADMGSTNFFDDLTLFDKGGVHHIQDMHPSGFEDVKSGYFFKMFRNGFTIPIDYDTIQTALKTRNSLEIEKMYRNMMVSDKKKHFWSKR
jgi:hypothetical protein